MRSNATILSLAALALSATAALSAPVPAPPTDRSCIALRDQFHSALETHQQSDHRREARYLANEGHSFCLTGDPSDGVNRYRQALQVLGVQPSA